GVGIAIALGVIGGVAGRRASAVDRGDPGSLVLAAAIQAVVFLAPLVSITLGWWTGGTLGMRAAGCRLVDATSGEKPSVEQILLRLAGSFYSLIALGAGFLWVGLSPTKTGWHDHLSGTVVVHGRPARPRWTEMGWQWMPQSTAPAPADGRVSPAAPAPRSPWTWTDVVPVLILFIPAAL